MTTPTRPAPISGTVAVAGGTFHLPRIRFKAIPAWFVSLAFHVAIVVALALATIPDLGQKLAIVTLVDRSEAIDNQLEVLQPLETPPLDKPAAEMMASLPKSSDRETPSLPLVDVFKTQSTSFEPTKINFAESVAPSAVNLAASIESIGSSSLRGRSTGLRGEMLAEAGGSKDSEAAVKMALIWLAKHQRRDGSWNFDHTRGAGRRLSPNPGTMTDSQNAATAMALLPFLGSGQTHTEGIYQEVVGKGLAYLVRRQQRDGSWWEREARMYSHGLAAICVCEAYAMTQDKALIAPTQNAILYIVRAQDRLGGGWRYSPGQGGDTSVLGWNLMALKSGAMAGMNIPPVTIIGASRFLDSVSREGGATYGYDQPGSGDAVTAIGLLSRMYLGWPREQPQLARGVLLLAQQGPSKDHLYFNYYATQVMRHYGGELWTEWNDKLRPQIVAAQDRKGDATGSWFYKDRHGAKPGGRLYCTSMATMILEVYYRHMPIYRNKAADDAFPLLGEEMKKDDKQKKDDKKDEKKDVG